MPYLNKSGGFERSRSIGHVPITENELIKESLRSFRIYNGQENLEIDSSLLISANTLGTTETSIRWVFSFDGSPQEVVTKKAFPSTRIGYVQIAGILVNLEQILNQGREHLVDPAIVRTATQEALYSIVLPGANVCRVDMPTVKDSWRAQIFDIFQSYTVEGTSLLNIFKLLVEHSNKNSRNNGVILARCSASNSCSSRDIDVPFTGTVCPSCGGQLFPTDALRVHEEVSEEQKNEAALNRLMSCLEHITMVGYLYFLCQRQPRTLGSVSCIMDGPLAIFGPQAWLHAPILRFLHELQESLTQKRLKPPLIIGIEKGGQFAEYAAAIKQHIPPQNLMLLPDDYIYQHILASRPLSNSIYGYETYYGQKFFYKTATGQLLTITVPKLSQTVNDPHNPIYYQFLPDSLALLDRIGTALYKDAVIPVALAHSYASIPLKTGSRVLTLLSKDFLAQ